MRPSTFGINHVAHFAKRPIINVGDLLCFESGPGRPGRELNPETFSKFSRTKNLNRDHPVDSTLFLVSRNISTRAYAGLFQAAMALMTKRGLPAGLAVPTTAPPWGLVSTLATEFGKPAPPPGSGSGGPAEGDVGRTKGHPSQPSSALTAALASVLELNCAA
ncbi:hypothetical protein PAPYR_10411 [Paratrimastix pyriformis]|uniref:Uncharacterized protein n=1 Tax=Paratrimastix pyriformis TaxID=342808 RepID=A0ABQ8UA86_9EUKA|nr:hypothetical protein PAPYR_10411 [Paratrimastix pyriformis]